MLGTMSPTPATTWHTPVMGREVLRYLSPRPGALIVDGTVGTGGHSLMILPHLLPDGKLVVIDRDHEVLERAKARLVEFEPYVTFIHDDYRNLPAILKSLGTPCVDGVVLDLGMSSVQVDQPERGFSFAKEGPLDMRMDRTRRTTAESLVNERSLDELTQLFWTLGEERFAARIAHRIIQERRTQPIRTTTQLARMIIEAVPSSARRGRLHPATRTFQALRLAVNDELGALETFLGGLPELLRPKGRAVILTFHSLEDRLVKRAFMQGMRDDHWAVLTKHVVRPSQEEVSENPRARSAKLRAMEHY